MLYAGQVGNKRKEDGRMVMIYIDLFGVDTEWKKNLDQKKTDVLK